MRKQYKRWCTIALILIAAAVGGRWYAQRTAVEILRPHIVGLIELGDVESVEMLLDAGMVELEKEWRSKQYDVISKKSYTSYKTPLFAAVYARDTEITRLLTTHGADVNALDRCECAAIHYVAMLGDADTFEVLLKAGAQMGLKDMEEYTALHYAAMGGHTACIKAMVTHGADLNWAGPKGQTPFDVAYKTVKDLIRSLGAKTKYEVCNPLHVVSAKGDTLGVRALLKSGLDVNARDESECTPLHCASNANTARILLQAGADVAAVSDMGATPLHYAAEEHRDDVAELLLEAGAAVNARDGSGDTPLLYTRKPGMSKMIPVLLSAGADPRIAGRYGFTILHHAAVLESSTLCAALIKAGADVNAKDDLDRTPFHCCSNVGSAKILLAAGANVNSVDEAGKTALDHQLKNKEMAALLRKHGAKTGKELDEEAKAEKTAQEEGK